MPEKSKDNYTSRHLSAIMFTDMVGYSALAQEDEERAIRLLEEHRKILREKFNLFDGRVIEVIGDAFFVEFKSVLSAAHCAVQIQELLHERNLNVDEKDIIRIRIGLHLGDVIHRDNQVIGDGVNIAARMEPLANPGCICLSEDVVRQIRNKIDHPLKYLGQRELKNIQLPFRLYQIILPWDKSAGYLDKPKEFFSEHKLIISILITFITVALLSIAIIKQVSFIPILTDKNQTSTEKRKNRIAVLPFKNISADKNYEYFPDGLTEEVSSVLSHILQLNVIARTSIMRYKNSTTPISEIADDLEVGLVIEGSVRINGENIKVTAQLIDTKTEELLFAETYPGNLSNVFEIQSAIALKVAQSLEINLLTGEQSNIKKQSTQVSRAYNNYLEGLFLLNKRSPESLLNSLTFFQEAIKLDPGYALAYTGIADTYHLLSSYGFLSPEAGFVQAKKAALRAISIDEKLAQGYNSLAAVLFLYEWNWEGAEQSFVKALELNPNNIQTLLWFGLYNGISGNFDEAVENINRALELDPVSPVARTDLGQIYYFKGNYDQAIKEYETSLSLDSNYAYTYAYLGQACAANGNYSESLNAFKKAISLTGGKDPATLAGLGYTYALQNKRVQAKLIIESLIMMDRSLYIHPVYFAIIHIGLGEFDLAFDWLEKGFLDRSEWMVFLRVEHMLTPLRSDARYSALLNKMNFK